MGTIGRIPEDCDAGRPGHRLLKQLQKLPIQPLSEEGDPVTLPPGRAKLSTNPRATGSPLVIITIGTAAVACFAALIAPQALLHE